MKKILFTIFTFLLLISNVNALKVVSLGDSVTSGYLLDDETKSYDNLLADTLDVEYYEYSYIGMRSDDLLYDLEDEELKSNIMDADIVIINIGANDLLDLLDYIDLSKVGIEIKYGTIPKVDLSKEFINNLKNYMREFFVNELEPMSIETANDFAIIFPSIIETIKEYNPDIKIYVNNLYNPFFNISIPLLQIDLSDVEEVAENAIASFNDTIYKYDDYEIVDVYSLLRNNKYLNVNPINLEFDPHPNIEGHEKIYELYLKELCYKVTYDNNDYYVIKGESINIEPKKKSGYKFVKWNYDLNNINSDIELIAIYKKTFNYLYLIPIGIIVVITILLIIKKKNK